MPFPDESLTAKSAVQDPAPPFTTGTSAAPCACGTGKEPRAKIEIDTISRPASQPVSHIPCEVCIRTPPQTETLVQVRRHFHALQKLNRNEVSIGRLILALIPAHGTTCLISRAGSDGRRNTCLKFTRRGLET